MLDPVADAPIREVHVIAVDEALTPDEAWAELCRAGVRATSSGGTDSWAAVKCDGVECLSILPDLG